MDVDLGLGSDLSDDSDDGDFAEYNQRVEEERKRRREELGQAEDEASGTMAEITPAADPEEEPVVEEPEEKEQEFDSDGEPIPQDPDATTAAAAGKSLAELNLERARLNAKRLETDDIAPAERRRIQQELILAKQQEDDR